MSLNADLSGTSVLLIQPLELEMGPLELFLKSLSFTLEGDPEPQYAPDMDHFALISKLVSVVVQRRRLMVASSVKVC